MENGDTKWLLAGFKDSILFRNLQANRLFAVGSDWATLAGSPSAAELIRAMLIKSTPSERFWNSRRLKWCEKSVMPNPLLKANRQLNGNSMPEILDVLVRMSVPKNDDQIPETEPASPSPRVTASQFLDYASFCEGHT